MDNQNRNLKEYEKNYNQLPFENHQVFFRRKNIIEQLKNRPHSKILEIGCGNEPLFKYIENVEKWVVVEPAWKFYEKATKIANNNVILIHNYLENSLHEIQATGINFDYIICSGLLHEVNNPNEILHTIYELCNKNTIVNINVPNAKSFHRILAYCMGLIPNIYHKSQTQKLMQQSDIVYDMELLKTQCENMGFKVINSGSYFIKLFTHQQMQECLNQHIFTENLLYGLNNLIEYMPEYGSEIFVELKKQNTI